MKISIFLFIGMLVMMPQAIATPFGDAIANYTNLTFVENVGPYSPDKNMQNSGSIRAWVDIVGFNKMVCENDVCYVPGDPADQAIVQYDVVANPRGILDKLDKSISVYVSGNNTIASLHVVLKYHTEACDEKGCWVSGRFVETKYFIDSEPSPMTYRLNQSINASVVFYNNTYSPKAIISPEDASGAYLIRYTYQNDSVEHIQKKGSIDITRKGVKFVDLYRADMWNNSNETVFARINDNVVINGANFSISDLHTTVIYPYDIAVPITNYNYTKIDYNPYNTFHPAFYFVSFLVLIPVWMLKKLSVRLNL